MRNRILTLGMIAGIFLLSICISAEAAQGTNGEMDITVSSGNE